VSHSIAANDHCLLPCLPAGGRQIKKLFRLSPTTNPFYLRVTSKPRGSALQVGSKPPVGCSIYIFQIELILSHKNCSWSLLPESPCSYPVFKNSFEADLVGEEKNSVL